MAKEGDLWCVMGTDTDRRPVEATCGHGQVTAAQPWGRSAVDASGRSWVGAGLSQLPCALRAPGAARRRGPARRSTPGPSLQLGREHAEKWGSVGFPVFHGAPLSSELTLCVRLLSELCGYLRLPACISSCN